eukprot:539466-Pleurochrysis_carterae.AAC.1
MLPPRSSRSCLHAGSAQRCPSAPAAPSPPCDCGSAPSLASRSRRAGCEQGSSRLQGPRTTQLTRE